MISECKKIVSRKRQLHFCLSAKATLAEQGYEVTVTALPVHLFTMARERIF